MWEALHKAGCNVMPHVPDRKTEGYGFSKIGIDLVRKKYNPECIISVDHGVVAHEVIKYASKLGIKIIVTDHHQKKKTYPKYAHAVLHTTQLSGSGLAYFVATHFVKKLGKETRMTKQLKYDYCSLAAIGTVADLVPLRGVNRSIVYHGLANFHKTQRFGLKHLIKEAHIDGKAISPYEVGYIIAPRINAFGRLTHGIDALRLLCTTKESRAREPARKAGDTNKMRQQLVKSAIKDAEKKVIPGESIIVVYSSSWNEGVIGLIASRLSDKYYRPAIAMTKSGNLYKGSVRSVPGFNIISFLRTFEELFVDIGGHDQAAGFTISSKNINKLQQRVKKTAEVAIGKIRKEKVQQVDVQIPLSKVTMQLAAEIGRLQPFGIGNPQPVFMSKANIESIEALGKNGDHLKIMLGSDKTVVSALYFSMGKHIAEFNRGTMAVCTYTLHIDTWRGMKKVKAFIKHLSVEG
jgi:single-stranded-DNA-specific exonuclease